MVQFLQRPRSFGEQIGEQLGSGLSQGIDFAAQAGLEKYKGEQKQKQLMLQGLLRNQQIQDKEQLKNQQQDTTEFENVFSQLRELNSSAGILPANPWGEKAKNREKMDVLSFQLERYARAAHTKGALSTKVYESLLSKLPSSSITEEKNLGRIEAWEDALLRKGAPEGKEQRKSEKTKFNPEHPEHKAKAEQLFKKYKDKEKVREALKKEFEGL